MPRKLKKTNPNLVNLIHELKKHSLDHNVALWKDIALRLEKPLRNWPVVTLKRLDHTVGDKEIAIVPGKVLSSGVLTKKIDVAAWAFTEKSKEKIKASGSNALSIPELMKKHPDGKNIRIVG